MKESSLLKRREFFARLLAAFAVPAVLASLPWNLRRRRDRPRAPLGTTSVTIHPLAVPRKNGSSSLHG